MGGWEEIWRLKLNSAKVEVEVEAELGKIEKCLKTVQYSCYKTGNMQKFNIFPKNTGNN